jgi:hypothetical protein
MFMHIHYCVTKELPSTSLHTRFCTVVPADEISVIVTNTNLKLTAVVLVDECELKFKEVTYVEQLM